MPRIVVQAPDLDNLGTGPVRAVLSAAGGLRAVGGDAAVMAEQATSGFGGLLRQLRAGAQLTQLELGKAAGVSPRPVSDLERGQWYRYHHLFGDMHRAELERREPGLIPALRRRAASWCLANDQPEEALEYSIAARDVDTAARLVERLWLTVYWARRRGTLERWVRWLDQQGGISGHPMIAVMARFLYTVTGRGRAVGRPDRPLAVPRPGLGR